MSCANWSSRRPSWPNPCKSCSMSRLMAVSFCSTSVISSPGDTQLPRRVREIHTRKCINVVPKQARPLAVAETGSDGSQASLKMTRPRHGHDKAQTAPLRALAHRWHFDQKPTFRKPISRKGKVLTGSDVTRSLLSTSRLLIA